MLVIFFSNSQIRPELTDGDLTLIFTVGGASQGVSYLLGKYGVMECRYFLMISFKGPAVFLAIRTNIVTVQLFELIDILGKI